jgi:hypothetical protein
VSSNGISVRSRWLLAVAAASGVLLAVTSGPNLRAQEPTEANIASGRRLYHQKADCQACHGWSGNGDKLDSQAPDGADLRASTLDRERLIFVIKCGLPGREMPAFDRMSYKDDRCLGRTQADLDRMGLELPDAGATLQNREVERLADFLMTKVIGKGEMDRATCIDFWGEDIDVCADLQN